MRLYGEIILELYFTCTMIPSVDLAHCRVSRAKDWVSVDCGTKLYIMRLHYGLYVLCILPFSCI